MKKKFIGILVNRAGMLDQPRELYVQAEFINLEHVVSYNRHSNIITMTNGVWYQLVEDEMIKFMDKLEEYNRET